MIYNEINKLELKDVNKKITDLNKNLIKLRFDKITNQLKDFKLINKNKKDIARLKTYLSSLKNK
jgi:ribosomal protein L29